MPLTEAEKRAKANYRKKKKRVTIEFCPTEMELYERLQAQANKQGYIKSLIREDMKKDGI